MTLLSWPRFGGAFPLWNQSPRGHAEVCDHLPPTPLTRFGSKSRSAACATAKRGRIGRNDYDAFHREQRIPVRRGRNRHEVKQFYIRFCTPRRQRFLSTRTSRKHSKLAFPS